MGVIAPWVLLALSLHLSVGILDQITYKLGLICVAIGLVCWLYAFIRLLLYRYVFNDAIIVKIWKHHDFFLTRFGILFGIFPILLIGLPVVLSMETI